MGIDFILDLVINQVGEEQARNIKNQLEMLADKMSTDKIYVLKKLGGKGVCLIMTNVDECTMDFSDKPQIIELEKMVRSIEV